MNTLSFEGKNIDGKAAETTAEERKTRRGERPAVDLTHRGSLFDI